MRAETETENKNSVEMKTQPSSGERTESPLNAHEKFRDFILEESRKGNVVFMGIEGLMVAPLEEFIKQSADGILYDLNRLPEVVMTFIDDPKWVNDYAVSMVIKRLREPPELRDDDLAHGDTPKALLSKPLTAHEIAAIMGLPHGPDAVKRLRARKYLRVTIVGTTKRANVRPENLYQIEPIKPERETETTTES